jgi:hypothetical protein
MPSTYVQRNGELPPADKTLNPIHYISE